MIKATAELITAAIQFVFMLVAGIALLILGAAVAGILFVMALVIGGIVVAVYVIVSFFI